MSVLSAIENWIVDDMTPRQVRYVKPVLPARATGQVAAIYRQIRRDFQLVPPLTLFSPAPDLLAGVWSLWREAQFATGAVSRSIKEAIAATVSLTNACPYCVDAHTGMLHASAGHDVVRGIMRDRHDFIADQRTQAIVEWASATRMPASRSAGRPPFSAGEAPEIIGTALMYHFVNRMVSIFLVDTPMPVPAGAQGLRSVAARLFGATVGKRIIARRPTAGDSLRYIPDSPLPDDLGWAAANAAIAAALAGCVQQVEMEGKRVLSDAVRASVKRQLSEWHGESRGLSRQWVNTAAGGLSDRDKPAARLALLAALAPYQVDDAIIDAFRNTQPGDRELLGVAAWSSMAAARRVCSWLATPANRLDEVMPTDAGPARGLQPAIPPPLTR